MKINVCQKSRVKMTTPADVRRFLVRLVNRSLEGKIDTKAVLDLSSVCRVILQAIEACAWAERVQKLEEQVQRLSQSSTQHITQYITTDTRTEKDVEANRDADVERNVDKNVGENVGENVQRDRDGDYTITTPEDTSPTTPLRAVGWK